MWVCTCDDTCLLGGLNNIKSSGWARREGRGLSPRTKDNSRRLLRRWNRKWNHVGKLIAATTNVVHEEAAEGRVSVSIYNHWL